MAASLRREVLSCFKSLHRTRCIVFQGDKAALNASRLQINDEFSKQKLVTDENTIKELLTYGNDCEKLLRTCVIQTVGQDGVYKANIRKEIEFQDATIPYTPMPDDMIGPFKRKKKCSDK